MIAGLEALTAIAAAAAPPVVTTQHRVIGADVCHYVAPITIAGEAPVPGKLFVTSARLVIVAGAPRAFPWHRLRALARAGRDLVIATAGAEGLRVQCNNFTDALVVQHLARRLGGR